MKELSFDLIEYGRLLGDWHSSQGDPIYAVGSYARIGERHPQRNVVESCVSALEWTANALAHDPCNQWMIEELMELSAQTTELLATYPTEVTDG